MYVWGAERNSWLTCYMLLKRITIRDVEMTAALLLQASTGRLTAQHRQSFEHLACIWAHTLKEMAYHNHKHAAAETPSLQNIFW